MLKAARKKQLDTYQEAAIRRSADLQQELGRQKGLAGDNQRFVKQGPVSKTTLPSKAVI